MTIKQSLRQEVEETQVAFHELLVSIPDETLGLPSDNPAWTIGEVLYHMSIAPKMLGTDAKMILKQNWLYKIIPAIIPKRLFDWLNKHLTKWGARKLSREFLRNEYDKANNATLKALDAIKEADFKKKLIYPDWDPLLSGEVTLERLFRYVKVHFDSHSEEIRKRINLK
jgi:hypothetical protein